MRRRNRDISVFNLSMLDVISGALGAFLLLVAVLIPWYKRPLAEENRQLRQRVSALEMELAQTRSERDQAQAERDQARAERDQVRAERDQARVELAQARADQAAVATALDQARRERDAARARANDLQRRLSKTFLVVLMKWSTVGQDIDLHVVDPSGAEFYFGDKTIQGRPGELTEDDTRGPGHEIWSIQEAPPGQYRIYYNFFSRGGNSSNPKVTGRVFFRDGSHELPEITLSQVKRKVLVVTLVVAADGQVTFR